jgi:hypothetical protein
LQRKVVVGIIIAVVAACALIPVGYGLMQRATVTGLQFHFNRIELANVDFSNTQTVGSMQNLLNDLENPSPDTLKEYNSIQSSIASPELIALDLLANTRYSFNIFLDIHNPSSIEAIVDRAQIKISINGHELPNYVSLSHQQKIPAGETKTVELQGLAVNGKDIVTILSNSIRSDYVLDFNYAITSYYPILFGEVSLPANMNLKMFIIPPKPTFNQNSGFMQVGNNQNSYKLSFTNAHNISLDGTLQVGVMKGNTLSTFGICDPACFAPIDNGFATFLRIKGHQIFGIQLLEYNNIKLSAGQTYTVDVKNPELRSNAKSAFIMRWIPDMSTVPYTLTVSFAGNSNTSEGEFHSSNLGTVRNVIYNIVRNFGYIGSTQFVSPRVDEGSVSSLFAAATSLTPTSITLKASSYSVSYGDKVTFSGRLTDVYGNGVANSRIDLKLNKPLAIDPVLAYSYTDLNGFYTIRLEIDRSDTSNIFAVFEGSSTYDTSRSQEINVAVYQALPLTPTYYSTAISLQVSSHSISEGSTLTFSGRLIDQNGNSVYGAVIQIKQDITLDFDPILASGFTDSDGRYSITWRVDRSGTLYIYAVYGGSSTYDKSRSSEIVVNVYSSSQEEYSYRVTSLSLSVSST